MRRVFRFLALMLFIFVVVFLLARSSILELRAKAEARFVEKRVMELKKVLRPEGSQKDPVYFVNQRGDASGPADEKFPSEVRDVLATLPSTPGGLRRGETFWTYLPLNDGTFVLTSTPYKAVIAWTSGFEARETRNVILVMVAFAILTSVWMWADRRALAAAQKAKMVDELERIVQERTEALKRMNRLARLGEFSASLAHEIRNPLGALVTAAKLLPDAVEEEREDLVGVLRREAGRLDRILSDFLSFSRDRRLNTRMYPLNILLQRSMEGWKRSNEFEQVTIEYGLDPSIEKISCDAEQLEQVFWNMAINGAQAMKGQGILRVTTQCEGRWARVTFRDQGPGIPPDMREKIFEPFYTEKQQGTGLGLSIASRFVEAHGGFIQVDSKEGAWTEFSIYLPRTPQPPPSMGSRPGRKK
jgi:signal transduction histidine kinase